MMGGVHATFCYEDILVEGSPVDIVIRGEAEATLLELVAVIQSGGGMAEHRRDSISSELRSRCHLSSKQP